ncbi:hypothetical protein J5N97_000653 [Dioscorea zingiberensis]|uniref:Uncharacterized protein n=1 Tax=Dioscorea zingiberensis TaxID=325984 RepID=A0A9D5H139_9LILI|nr:hypothetical protein J5N97_000653 [Dioscorea zingiberensis]
MASISVKLGHLEEGEKMYRSLLVMNSDNYKEGFLGVLEIYVAAAAFADEARTMDLADRYLNSECVRHMLQADQVALAEKTAVLFTKDGEQHNNLHDMQCMWYELASE